MKTYILILFIGILFTGCASISKTPKSETPKSDVQQPMTETMSRNLSAIAGVGMSDINGGKSWEPKMGGLIGIETKLHKFSEKSSLKTGINFSFQGANYTESYEVEPYLNLLKNAHTDNEFSGTVTLSYINIPFLYYYKCDAGFYGEIGIQPSFLISAKDKPDAGSSYDFKDYINTFDVGIPVGAGYTINDQLGIGVRAVFGLTNINSDGTEMYSSDDNDKNFVLFGLISYRFTK